MRKDRREEAGRSPWTPNGVALDGGVEVCTAPVPLQWDELARSPPTNGEEGARRIVPCCAPLLGAYERVTKNEKEARAEDDEGERKREGTRRQPPPPTASAPTSARSDRQCHWHHYNRRSRLPQ